MEDLQQVGKGINQAQKAYDQAHNKFSLGRGNVIRQAELLREMGVKPSKTLPANLVEAASTDMTSDIAGLADSTSSLDAVTEN